MSKWTVLEPHGSWWIVDPPPPTAEFAMQCLLLLFSDEAGWSTLSIGDRQRWMGRVPGLHRVADQGRGLQGREPPLVERRCGDRAAARGKANVMDGPFAETKEQLAGYFIIEVPDFDAAIAWAARHPAASHGAVEVRQIGNPPTP
jgi:hypothetical protein